MRVARIDRGEVLVLFLRAENLEALHERQAGVDHHRELAGEDRQVLRRRPSCRVLPVLAFVGRLRLLLGRSDPRDQDLLAPQRGDRRVHRVGDALAGDGLLRRASVREYAKVGMTVSIFAE